MRKSNPDLADDAAPIARRIHAILTKQGLHHVDVSLKAGLGPGYLRDILRGKSKRPNYVDLLKIADALGVDCAALSEQGAAAGDKIADDKSYTESELAVLDLWGHLSDVGRDKAIGMLAKLIVTHRRR